MKTRARNAPPSADLLPSTEKGEKRAFDSVRAGGEADGNVVISETNACAVGGGGRGSDRNDRSTCSGTGHCGCSASLCASSARFPFQRIAAPLSLAELHTAARTVCSLARRRMENRENALKTLPRAPHSLNSCSNANRAVQEIRPI